MKKLVAVLLAAGLLALAGYDERMPRDVADPNHIYKLGIAKTPTHLYGVCAEGEPEDWWEVLYRMPLDNIAQKEEIFLPKEYGEFRLRQVWISGISANWLFVGCEYIKKDDRLFSIYCQYVFYCVSLETGKVKLVAGGDGNENPLYYNAGSNSLIYTNYASDDSFRIEALNLDTGKRSILYNSKGRMVSWGFSYDGMLYFTTQDRTDYRLGLGTDNYMVIDHNNRIFPMACDDLLLEYNCKEIKQIQCGDQALVLEYHHDGDEGVELQLLDADGNKIKTILRAYAVDSVSYGLAYCFNGLFIPDNLVMMVCYVGDYDYDGYLYALYDTATGALYWCDQDIA